MRTNNTDTDYALNSTFTEVFAYNVALPIRVDSCMIYGIAACLTHKTWSFGLDWSLAPYYSGFGYDVDLKAYLFEATEGDSLVRLVKKQNFSIKKGQYPDKMLHLSDTGGMRAPVYEFYFDTPVMVRGSILVGLHPTNDEKKFYEININLDRQGFCSPGYIAVIKNDSIFLYWSADCLEHWSGDYSVPDAINLGVESGLIPFLNPIIRLPNNAVDEVGEAGDGVEVSPNPSRGRAMVHSMRAIRSVEVCDMSGRVVLRKQVNGDLHTVELSVSLPRGCYVVRVVTVQGAAVKKLVVE